MARKYRQNFSNFSIIALLLLIFALPVLVLGTQKIQQLLSEATGISANIRVDPTHSLGMIEQNWRAFAQGGEEEGNILTQVVPNVRQLQPQYIRIDHLYDHHPTVGRDGNGQLTFNFASLDMVVDSIVATGATPFLSLSYMPSAIASGDVTSTPRDWSEWALVVQRTIEHYSGVNNRNLSDVYYEVWNEPDLFGNWKYYGDKNYLTLYLYAVQGAQNATNTNAFKIGGPATTQLYKNWIVALADFVESNNLRLDFVSWHHYTFDPGEFNTDAGNITEWLRQYPRFLNTPRIISEWGFDSNINPGYDGNLAAAHTIATVQQALGVYDQIFSFELVDGKSPDNQAFWGRWGLLTHPSQGKLPKPRFEAFLLLNQLAGDRLYVAGEGTWVRALAAQDGNTMRILLTNYDRYGNHNEVVPVTVSPITNGTYTIITKRLNQAEQTQTTTVTDNNLVTQLIMQPNNVVLLTINPS
ncbi:hypothetical protein C4579_04760 [Candidatus Microgenomates bacterium]|nr:MAG: hypothetical protein C4579_04760 [Candidatus Microgenomates bacterium]